MRDHWYISSIEKRFIDNLSSLKKNIIEDQIRITVNVATISPANRATLD